MVEAAYDYVATVVESRHKRGMVAQTFGALAAEIVFKSYFAKVARGVGTLDERYVFDKAALAGKASPGHDLTTLARALRPDLRAYLLESSDYVVLVEFADAFTASRYFYEPTAPSASSDEILRLAAKLICKTVYLYKARGCTDPFVVHLDVDQLYFSVVQGITQACDQ
jgi:hypothetical protein